MKNATAYGNKIKGIFPKLKKHLPETNVPEDIEPLAVFVLGVLRENATLAQALDGLGVLREEFVDFNELRVAPPKDIAEALPANMPEPRAKAERLTVGLNRIYDQENRLDFDHTADMSKRDLRTHLREKLEFRLFTEAYLMLYFFGGHAVPVDDRLVNRLKEDGLASPDAAAADAGGRYLEA